MRFAYHAFFSSLSPEIIAALRKLHDNVFATLLPRVISIVDMQLTQKDLDVYYGLVSAWYSILCLNKWLEATEEPGTTRVAIILFSLPHLFWPSTSRPLAWARIYIKVDLISCSWEPCTV